ncbi:MAG TPA: hypothetical protein VJ577_01325 [Burkholderiaceae bacterium]|nr:hypothetical protein [Burkholderiaceae bacterium]
MTTPQACNCRRCGRDLNPNTATFEAQESLVISYRAGYGSILGDGNVVSSTLCQHCVQALLGPWLQIVEDDPFRPQVPLQQPQGAYQPNQLQAPATNCPSREELRSLFLQLKDEDK